MKRIAIGICVAVVLVAGSRLVPVRAQEASTNATGQAANGDTQSQTKNWADGNPLKIALLKWYQANLTTSFSVGKTKNSNPYGLAFDGQNIWTANRDARKAAQLAEKIPSLYTGKTSRADTLAKKRARRMGGHEGGEDVDG